MNNFYCVSSLVDEDTFFPCYEQAVAYAEKLANSTHCGNAIYQGRFLVGVVDWDGYEILPGGGFREKYAYKEVKLPPDEIAEAMYPELFALE